MSTQEPASESLDFDAGAEADVVVAGLGAAVSLRSLAHLAVHVLELQQVYFRTRTRDALVASKEAEKHLRRAALAAASR